MILASGPGPNSVITLPQQAPTPDDILTWMWIGVCCALLLLAEAVLAYYINRKQSAAAWRHPFVVLPASACAFTVAVSVYAWTLYQSTSTAMALYQSAWTTLDPSPAVARALDAFLPFGVAALVGTLALLAAGAVALLLPDERLTLSRPIGAHIRHSRE